MPSCLFDGPYRFFFYSSDGSEPRHVHIERDDRIAKFWLDPVRIARSGGFGRAELNKLAKLVVEHKVLLMEAWDGYFSA